MDELKLNDMLPTAVTEEQDRAPAGQLAIMFVMAGLVILVDQFTKYLIETNLEIFEIWAPIPAIEPFFRIMHVFNTGTAFGLFPNGSFFFGLMAVIISGAIIYYNHTLPQGNVWLRVALGLTLGGAVGNLIDRVRLGHVTDFLDFGPWPLFNVADMAIVGGAILLGWLVFLDARAEQKAKQASANPSPEESHLEI
ncbi:MAG: signal peptidase II [Chloroflexi bacterium]|nr:signal peptidase II [Chloroflexota bacterium]